VFVLGIDPGLSRCGYGALEERPGGAATPIAVGVLTTPPKAPLPERLAELQRELRALIAETHPDVVVVERVFFQVNVRTAMSVGQASGLAMAEAINAGGAGKDEMERMVQLLLGIDTPLRPVDAADAVALALCHLAHAPRLRMVSGR